MRPFEIMEANIMLPIGLSIKSGRIAPIARYLGSIIVLSRGIKIQVRKIFPMKCLDVQREASGVFMILHL